MILPEFWHAPHHRVILHQHLSTFWLLYLMELALTWFECFLKISMVLSLVVVLVAAVDLLLAAVAVAVKVALK